MYRLNDHNLEIERGRYKKEWTPIYNTLRLAFFYKFETRIINDRKTYDNGIRICSRTPYQNS